jgi:hypothetical protein
MAGNKELQALIKRPAAEGVWIYCMIHRELLATKELYPELSEVMGTMIKTVNYIKSRPLESTIFADFCKEMRPQYQLLLYYCNFLWLWRENSVARVYSLGEEVEAFLLEENLVHDLMTIAAMNILFLS